MYSGPLRSWIRCPVVSQIHRLLATGAAAALPKNQRSRSTSPPWALKT